MDYFLEFTTDGTYINDIWNNIPPNPSTPMTESTFRHANPMSDLAELSVLDNNANNEVSESVSINQPMPIVAESPLILINNINDSNYSNTSNANYSNNNNHHQNCYTTNEFIPNNRQNTDELYKFVIDQVDNTSHNNHNHSANIVNNNNNFYKYNFEINNDASMNDDDTIPVVDDNEQFADDEDYDSKWPNSTRVCHISFIYFIEFFFCFRF